MDQRTEAWVRCWCCGRKLFRLLDADAPAVELEIKCHSCKSMNIVDDGKARPAYREADPGGKKN